MKYSSTINITIDVRMLNSSGIGTYIRNVLPFVVSSLPDIQFNLLGNTADISKLQWANAANVALIPCTSPIYSISEQYELAKKIPSQSTLFWSPHYNIPLFQLKSKKKLVTIHDVFHLAFFDTLNVQQKIYAKAITNAAVRLSSKIISVSNFSKSEIIRYTSVDADKISVIPCGVDQNTYKVSKTSTDYVKEKYHLPDKYILYVGNVKPHKNLKNLVLAVNKLNKDNNDTISLVIVGEEEKLRTADEEVFAIINNIELSNHIFFTGYVQNNELPAIYSQASLLVLPSFYEGFGLPPLEAMTCGCPTVVSKAASLPEVCGDATLYVDPYSVESVADGIQRVLTDSSLRQNLIAKGLERVKLFSWEQSAKKHIKVIEEVLQY